MHKIAPRLAQAMAANAAQSLAVNLIFVDGLAPDRIAHAVAVLEGTPGVSPVRLLRQLGIATLDTPLSNLAAFACLDEIKWIDLDAHACGNALLDERRMRR